MQRHAEVHFSDDAPLGEHVFFIHVTLSPYSETHTATISTAENTLNGHTEILTLRIPVYMHVMAKGWMQATAGHDHGQINQAGGKKEVDADALPSRAVPGIEPYATWKCWKFLAISSST